MGLKLVIRDERQHDGQPFSRTPRGFEARRLRGSSETPELSAEPLVGLKPFDSNDFAGRCGLSAEPLVGLKPIPHWHRTRRSSLSAEPLVGLKLPLLLHYLR